jgi:hypothetical protein
VIGGTGGLDANQLKVQRVREPTCDLVLHRQEIARIAVEPLCPQMRTGFGIDELDIYTHLLAQPTDASFQNIPYTEIATDLLSVDGLILVGERGIARNHKHVSDPRQVGRQIVRDPVCKVLLLPIVAEIGEWQHDNRKSRYV